MNGVAEVHDEALETGQEGGTVIPESASYSE
jgi:hypothetical protein